MLRLQILCMICGTCFLRMTIHTEPCSGSEISLNLRMKNNLDMITKTTVSCTDYWDENNLYLKVKRYISDEWILRSAPDCEYPALGSRGRADSFGMNPDYALLSVFSLIFPLVFYFL